MSKVFESLLRADQERGQEKDSNDLGANEKFFSSAGMASTAAAVGKERPHAVRTHRFASHVEDASRYQIAKLVQRVFLLSPNTKLVAFAGVESGAGCSWVTARAAETLALQVNGSVCVVDANLRSPSLHRVFGVSNENGLTDAVLASGAIEGFTQQLEVPGLWLLSSGSKTAGAEEVLASQAMRERMRVQRRERELQQRRERVAGEHRQEAGVREQRAEVAERRARMAGQEAQRERAEAQLHQERAAMHEEGLADPELVQDHERKRFAGTSAVREDDPDATAARREERGAAVAREDEPGASRTTDPAGPAHPSSLGGLAQHVPAAFRSSL